MFNEYGDLINLSELCEILTIGRNTAYSLLNTGLIKGFKCGRTWRVPKEAVEAYVRLQSRL